MWGDGERSSVSMGTEAAAGQESNLGSHAWGDAASQGTISHRVFCSFLGYHRPSHTQGCEYERRSHGT